MDKNPSLKNFSWFLLGFLLTLPPITIGWATKLLPIKTNRPWSGGMIHNTLRAWKRYTVKSWVRRLITMWRMPHLVPQLIKILSKKQKVELVGQIWVDPADLIPQHDVLTDHPHHRQRVVNYRNGVSVSSEGGPIIVVDDLIEDGHHRVAAAKEAGVKAILVEWWITT